MKHEPRNEIVLEAGTGREWILPGASRTKEPADILTSAQSD